jgi:hypothetical protein
VARTAVAYSSLVTNGSLADPAGTVLASGAGNGAQIPAVTGGGAVPELTVIRVSNASGGTGTASVLAGSQPLAMASGQGPDTVSVATGAVGWLGPFESARFIQPDGSLIVETSVAMTLTAFKVPRH